MGRKKQSISVVINTLNTSGKKGTANAIKDAVRFQEKATRIFARCISDFNSASDLYDREIIQNYIDILTELFEGSEW